MWEQQRLRLVLLHLASWLKLKAGAHTCLSTANAETALQGAWWSTDGPLQLHSCSVSLWTSH